MRHGSRAARRWALALCLVPVAARALAPCTNCAPADTTRPEVPRAPAIDLACGSDGIAAIEARRAQSPAWTCPTAVSTLTIGGVVGKYRDCTQGRIVWSPTTCAQRMPIGTIYARYFLSADAAAVRTAVGFPTAAPESSDPDGIQRFVTGHLATNAAGRAAIVGGTTVPARERDALVAKWRQSTPGNRPTQDTIWTGAGAHFTTDPYLGFDKTFAVRAGASTAYVVQGPIQDKWVASGGFDGSLGWPTGDESCLDAPCRYTYSNFERGHVRWSTGPDRIEVATVVAGAVPATPRRIASDPDLGKDTFAFTLSRSLLAEPGAPDGDQDGLDDDAEKQLAFLAAPRIFWDEEESSSENQDFVRYRRLDMVQVRPRSANVSRWTTTARQWITIRFLMAYPEQYTDGPGGSHMGDAEMFELRLFNARGTLSEWRVGEFVFPPHGGQEDDRFYYQYYGDVGVLATRAKLLNTAHIWIAADEDAHGSWGGSEVDSDHCQSGPGTGLHDCFDGNLEDALAAGRFWWFDPSRDIGEPEALRYDAWPSTPRGSSAPPFTGPAVVPQIKREPNNPYAAYIENNSGRGVAREYIRYTAASPDISTAKAFCGWRCPARKTDGQCEGYPYNGFPPPVTVQGVVTNAPPKCDGGGSKFPSTGRTTTTYGSLYPVGVGKYRWGVNEPNGTYSFADFTYQLWGLPNILPLTSGNLANQGQYPSTTVEATTTFGASFPVTAVLDGDRRGTGWGEGGGWASAGIPSATAPQSVRVDFGRTQTIRRVDVFSAQEHSSAPKEPTPAMTTTHSLRDFDVQYCLSTAASGCSAAGDGNWQTIATVTGNDKVWRTFTFAAVRTRAIRIRVTAATEPVARTTTPVRGTSTIAAPVATVASTTPALARIAEIEAWE